MQSRIESWNKAAAYTLNMWNKLERYLEYEEVELSNNLAENSIRLCQGGEAVPGIFLIGSRRG